MRLDAGLAQGTAKTPRRGTKLSIRPVCEKRGICRFAVAGTRTQIRSGLGHAGPPGKECTDEAQPALMRNARQLYGRPDAYRNSDTGHEG